MSEEELKPNKEKNFVAPDESQRINDPEEARTMASHASLARAEAAGERDYAKEMLEQGETEAAEEALESAKKWDEIAEEHERAGQYAHTSGLENLVQNVENDAKETPPEKR